MVVDYGDNPWFLVVGHRKLDLVPELPILSGWSTASLVGSSNEILIMGGFPDADNGIKATRVVVPSPSSEAVKGLGTASEAGPNPTSQEVKDGLCLALQDRLEKVEKEVQSLKGENLALKLVLEKKTFASVVKDGEVEVDSWKVVAASATKCTLKRHSAVDLNNRFSTLSDEREEGASNTTSATPSVSVERGSSAVSVTTDPGETERWTDGAKPDQLPVGPQPTKCGVTSLPSPIIDSDTAPSLFEAVRTRF
ncbi:hypothetical protein Hamer_G022022 [Homarus americanus]|uniref:Uncharacterized protein n=1 Tax=Homarus americanus TaxID=6706 RepID=A0A8J5N6P9_HOMAM|nr:hypothetical protein Hamer_G022022 [Homarus americanus]